jgi:glutamine amidotransferase
MNGVKVGIVDYQSGNIRSVANAVEYAGGEVKTVKQPGEVDGLTHLILPGVGAFGFCAERLRASGLLPTVERWAFEDKKPLLGICVGMQLMADYGEEQGRHEGLGWVGGAVTRLEKPADSTLRIPHVGWNAVEFTESFGQFKAGERPDFYFDHSFALDAPTHGTRTGVCEHGRPFSALVTRDNIVAAQFHPEKSQTAGMKLLQSFFAM